jgi:hypothetical protein
MLCHSSLETLFLSHMFWFFTLRTKNHATYMVQINYLLVNKKAHPEFDLILLQCDSPKPSLQHYY